MPTQLHSLRLPAQRFSGWPELSILKEVIEVGVWIEAEALTYSYLLGGKKGKVAIENDGQAITLYFTTKDCLKRKYLATAEAVDDYILWNVFRPHRFRRYEEYTGEKWYYVFLAPRQTNEFPEFQMKRSAGGLVGSFFFSDWLFASAGGELLLLEAYAIDYDGSVSRINNPRVIDLLKMV